MERVTLLDVISVLFFVKRVCSLAMHLRYSSTPLVVVVVVVVVVVGVCCYRSCNCFVLDPARIDRSVVDPPMSLGVGSTSVRRPTIGEAVTLSCQTNGINDPSTGWFFVNETSGCGMEIPITDGV